jgi:hypothetical protein
MSTLVAFFVRQGHLIWLFSIVNIGIGFVISGFNPLAQSISEVALEAPLFAYTHRFADIAIGLSMCIFGVALNALTSRKISFSMISIGLLGVSMVSAGIWTLESPLHLLYNLSIFMIIIPVVFALELKEKIESPPFETFCLITSFVHVFVFWCIYAGFIPQEYNGLIQRAWAVLTMGWFGVAAHLLIQGMSGYEEVQPAANGSAV